MGDIGIKSLTWSWPTPGLSKASNAICPFVWRLAATDLTFFENNLLLKRRSRLASSSSLSMTVSSELSTGAIFMRRSSNSLLLRPSN